MVFKVKELAFVEAMVPLAPCPNRPPRAAAPDPAIGAWLWPDGLATMDVASMLVLAAFWAPVTLMDWPGFKSFKVPGPVFSISVPELTVTLAWVP